MQFPSFDPDKPNSPFCSKELLWAKVSTFLWQSHVIELMDPLFPAMGLVRQEDMPMVHRFKLSGMGFWGVLRRWICLLPRMANFLTYGNTGWTRAWITNIIAFDDLRPTAIEAIIFWFASSLGMSGGFTIPEVCDEPVYRTRAHPCAAYDVMWERHQKVSVLALSQIS